MTYDGILKHSVGVLDLYMADVDTVELTAWLNTLPAPTDDSSWDAIFLVPRHDFRFEELIAWYWRTFVHPDGDLYGCSPLHP